MLCGTMFVIPSGISVVEAAKVSYTGSSSFMSGKYYTQLTNVDVTNNPRTNIVNIAKSQLGYQEGNALGDYSGLVLGANNFTEYGLWYTQHTNPGYNYAGAQWCAMFVSWCAYVAGITSDIVYYHSYTETQWGKFRDQGRSYTWEQVQAGEYTPIAGDIVYFLSASSATNDSRTVNHVGIVTEFTKDKVMHTVEGNASSTEFTTNGGCVTSRTYDPSTTYVAYVCNPNYSNVAAGEPDPIIVDGDFIPASMQAVVFDAEFYAANNPDVVNALGSGRDALYRHFINFGVSEGRRGSPIFSVKDFVTKNDNVNVLYGGISPNYKAAMIYFCETAAFNDTLTYHTATPENMGLSFTAKIALTNADLNFSLSDTDVIAYTPSTADAQVYTFERQSDGTYKGINKKNGYVLQIASNSKASGTNVIIGADTGAATQRWNFYKNYDGTYILQNVCAPACVVSVSANAPASGDSIILSKYGHKAAQQFKLISPDLVSGSDMNVWIGALPTYGAFTAAGYNKWTYFLHMGTGGENNAMTHSIGTFDWSKYSKVVISYGNDPGAGALGTLNLKTTSGTVVASKVITPAKGWKATTTVEFDITSFTSGEELFLNYVNDAPNGILITKIKYVVPGLEIVPYDGPIDEPITEPTIDGGMLHLANAIDAVLLVKKDSFEAGGFTNPIIKAEFDNETYELLPNVSAVDGVDCYAFTFKNVPIQRMNDSISAILYAEKDGEVCASESYEFSVASYAYEQLRTTTDSKLKTLLVDLINYGSYAQLYTKYNSQNLVNAALTTEQAAWGTQTLRELVSAESKPATAGDAEWTRLGLIIESKVDLMGYFSIPTAMTGVTVRATDSDGNLISIIRDFEETQGANGVKNMSFVFDKLTAKNMSDVVGFTVYNSQGVNISGQYLFSIESAAQKNQNSTNAELADFLKAMMMYGDSARAYEG